MKKNILLLLVFFNTLNAATFFDITYGLRDFDNSKKKRDGYIYDMAISTKTKNSSIKFGYELNRVNLMSRDILEIDHIKMKYLYKASNSFDFKLSYIDIGDNLSPTNSGAVYGLGLDLNKKLYSLSFDYYFSDYIKFNVSQFDFGVSKNFKFKSYKIKSSLFSKYIDINGDKYGNYYFKDKNYFSSGLKVLIKKNRNFIGLSTMSGKRLFTILNDGMNVQHHALEQNIAYMLSFGRKFKKFNLVFKYVNQTGKELPENRSNVKSKISALSLKYKF